jgi:AcrR family transcriptional regulator
MTDVETRERLLSAATRLFADHGFAKVTVRDICKGARANVAAVNYHFGGKVGLYGQVLESAMAIMQQATLQAQEEGVGKPAEEQLRVYVQVFVQRIASGRSGDKAWIHGLMMHEMSDPTPALDLVIDRVIRPRMKYLNSIVAALLGYSADDRRVSLCAMSIHAQCMSLMNAQIGERIDPRFRMTKEKLDGIAEHITKFSLAGINASRA